MTHVLNRVLLFICCGAAAFAPASRARGSTVYPKSDHYDGRRFFNPGVTMDKGIFDLLKWQFGGGKQSWPRAVTNVASPNVTDRCPAGRAHVTFINHATHLIQLAGLNVLTDPVFSDRVSPFSWIGPKRVRPPGLAFADLPPIDVIVISHSHYDHLDVPSLKRLAERDHPTLIVPLGVKSWLEPKVNTRVIELDWWDRSDHVTFVPAQHWSARTPFDRNESLWGGYVIEAGGVKVYFAGDTGYGPQFKNIAARLGSPDVAILPIGAYDPRWFMMNQHMDPDDAVKAFQDLAPRLALGTHYGTFQLTNEGIDDPPQRLAVSLNAAGIALRKFLAPATGETVVFPR